MFRDSTLRSPAMQDRKRNLSRAELDVLRAREARYATLVENSPYCIHEIDHEGRLSSMNPAGLAMVGAEDECEIVGIHYLDFVCEDDKPRIEGLLSAAFDGQFSECEFVAVNGRVISTNFVPLPRRTDSSSCLMGISQDVTDRRRLETELNQSRKLDAIGRLAGGVAHDFNNLLTVILGSSEVLMDAVDGDAAEEVEQIQRAAERAAELTTQLLTFARRRMVRPTVVDIAKHLREAESFLRRILTENIQLDVEITGRDLLVTIDAGQLDQVLVNLVANARDAMPSGGELRITAAVVELDAVAAAGRPPLSAGPHVCIAVEDTGGGIPPEARDHVFEPFYTTRGVRGTGLGLATCHGILTQARSSIRVEDGQHGGARFVMQLPVAAESRQEPTTDGEQESDAPASRILVVEDAEDVRRTAVRALRGRGHEVLEAASAEDALEVLTSTEPIDLLVADVVLPGMSGRELAETLVARQPALRVLYCSGYTDDLVLHHGVENDALHFLQKPYTPTTLVQAIARVLTTG